MNTEVTPHVLLVEDNLIALSLIEALTIQAGLLATAVTHGERALELVKSSHFDLIITDIGLPDISGYQLAYAIRQWEKDTHKKQIPIIGLTAQTEQEAKEECLKSGMNFMLSKPIQLKTIQELVKKFIYP